MRQVGAGDLHVRLEVEGDPVPLSPGVDLAAYRIAQEGLTNAVRHSGATEARVLVRYTPRQLEVEVADNGRGLAAPTARHGGHGLVGIRERVALYDGTVPSSPRPGGGVRLAASLPLGDRRRSADDHAGRVLIVDDQGMVRAGLPLAARPTSPTSRWSARPPTARRPSTLVTACARTSP